MPAFNYWLYQLLIRLCVFLMYYWCVRVSSWYYCKELVATPNNRSWHIAPATYHLNANEIQECDDPTKYKLHRYNFIFDNGKHSATGTTRTDEMSSSSDVNKTALGLMLGDAPKVNIKIENPIMIEIKTHSTYLKTGKVALEKASLLCNLSCWLVWCCVCVCVFGSHDLSCTL